MITEHTPPQFDLAAGKKRLATIYIDDLTKFLLTQYGGGNFSLGVRLAARAVSSRDGSVQSITPAAVKAVSETPEARRGRAPKVEMVCEAPRWVDDASPTQRPSSVLEADDDFFGDLFRTPFDPNAPE